MSKHGMTHPAGARKRPEPGAQKAARKKNAEPQNSVAPAPAPAVTLDDSNATPATGMTPVAQPATPARSMKTMDLTLTRSTSPRKSQRLVIYNIEGRSGSVQFLSTLFGGDQKSIGNPPATLTLSGEFAEARVAKPKETKEERKARLAALPKPTLAEKVAKAEARAEALRAKLAKAAAAETAPAA
jgi:hypothetical protein